MDLEAMLPALLPRAIAWAEEQMRLGLRDGTALDRMATALADRVGVRRPGRIRICPVERFPLPADAELRRAATQTGLLMPDGMGLTLGYAVFLRHGHESDARLQRHEFRHVRQFEDAGSLAAFLTEYLSQIVRLGYERAPLELDARAHEAD